MSHFGASFALKDSLEEGTRMNKTYLSIISILIFLTGCSSGGFNFGYTVLDEPPDGEGQEIYVDDFEDDDPSPLGGLGGTGGFGGEIPETPAGLSITSTSINSLSLSWGDVLYESGYKIYRKTGTTGSYAEIESTSSPNVTTYENSGLSQSTTYCYQVTAYNNSGESARSNEACGTTDHCTNTAGPEINIDAPSTSTYYPTASRQFLADGTHGAESFYRDPHVYYRFDLSSGDSCDNTFDITVNLFKAGETTNPVYTHELTRGTGSNIAVSWGDRWRTPYEQDADEFLGFYDLVITATDGTFSDSQTYENFFELAELPLSDSTSPELASFTLYERADDDSWEVSDGNICPRQYYRARAIHTENLIPPLPSDWVKAVFFEDGVRLDGHRYGSTAYDYPYRHHDENPTEAIEKVYSVNGMDLFGNWSDPADGTVTVTIIRDTEAPEISVTFPSTTHDDLENGESYTVTVQGDDNCRDRDLDYVLDFVATDTTVYELVSSTDAANNGNRALRFTPNGIDPFPPVGTSGHLRVTATDVGGNVTQETSETEYTFTISQRPQLDLTLVPDSGFSTGMTLQIHLEAEDDDLDKIVLEGVYYIHENTPPNEITDPEDDSEAFESGMDVEWVIPALPGTYVIYAIIRDTVDGPYTAADGVSIAVTGNDESYQVLFLDTDLNESMPFTETVQFDIDADDVLEWTSWLNPEDGYLILDRNTNDLVDDINDFAFWQELYDQAGDVIEEDEALFSELKVWIDADSDGETDDEELFTFEELNIFEFTLEPCCSFQMLPPSS